MKSPGIFYITGFFSLLVFIGLPERIVELQKSLEILDNEFFTRIAFTDWHN